MSKKRLLIVALLSIVLFSFAACNSDNDQGNNNKSYETSVLTDESSLLTNVSDSKSENSFNSSVLESSNSESTIAESSTESSIDSSVVEESTFKSTELNIGDTIKLDFVEMGIDTYGVSDTILPTDTSSVYSYISDVENEKYFFIKGTIKNLSGSTYDVEDMVIQMVFDNKYTYNGSLSACAYTNDFFGENVKPLGKVEYYIHSSVPDELIESYKNCTISFAFKTDFAGSKYSLDLDECEYKYKLNISK